MYDISDGYDVTAENRTEVECDDWVFDQSVFTSTYVTEVISDRSFTGSGQNQEN